MTLHKFAVFVFCLSSSTKAVNVWDDSLTFMSQNGLQDEYIMLSLQNDYPSYSRIIDTPVSNEDFTFINS